MSKFKFVGWLLVFLGIFTIMTYLNSNSEITYRLCKLVSSSLSLSCIVGLLIVLGSSIMIIDFLDDVRAGVLKETIRTFSFLALLFGLLILNIVFMFTTYESLKPLYEMPFLFYLFIMTVSSGLGVSLLLVKKQ